MNNFESVRKFMQTFGQEVRKKQVFLMIRLHLYDMTL